MGFGQVARSGDVRRREEKAHRRGRRERGEEECFLVLRQQKDVFSAPTAFSEPAPDIDPGVNGCRCVLIVAQNLHKFVIIIHARAIIIAHSHDMVKA